MKVIFQKIINSKAVAITLIFSFLVMFIPETQAASLTSISDELSRLREGSTSNHTIKFTTPSGIQNGDTIQLTFPASSFTMGASLTGVTIADGAGADNAVTSSNWLAPTLTITASATSIVGLGNVATIKIPSAQITNPTGISSDTSYIISIGGTFADTGSFAVVILENTDGTIDQFTVDATVDPSITFVLNGTAVNLGTLTVSSVSTGTTSFTVNTNAAGGYTTYVYDDGNLRSGANDVNDVADGTVTAGVEEYGMSTSKAGQDIAATSGNNTTATTATSKTCASASNPVSNDSTTLTLHASVAGTTAAGSYSHTITVIAAGKF